MTSNRLLAETHRRITLKHRALALSFTTLLRLREVVRLFQQTTSLYQQQNFFILQNMILERNRIKCNIFCTFSSLYHSVCQIENVCTVQAEISTWLIHYIGLIRVDDLIYMNPCFKLQVSLPLQSLGIDSRSIHLPTFPFASVRRTYIIAV